MDWTGILVLEWNFNPFCYTGNTYCNVCDYNATIFCCIFLCCSIWGMRANQVLSYYKKTTRKNHTSSPNKLNKSCLCSGVRWTLISSSTWRSVGWKLLPTWAECSVDVHGSTHWHCHILILVSVWQVTCMIAIPHVVQAVGSKFWLVRQPRERREAQKNLGD